jgi:hypothetical protein
VKPLTLIEVLDAAHLTAFVEGPFHQRGGIMLIGPPETLKTTMIEIALEQHPNALVMSDINMRSLNGMKDEFTNGKYSSIGFLDYQKLYERGLQTAVNLEGTIRMMVEEGYTHSSHDDPSSPSTKARSFVVAAMVETFFKQKSEHWRNTGFMRRWLCCLLYMPPLSRNKLVEAVSEWKKIDFDGIRRVSPTTPIPLNITREESQWILRIVKDQPSQSTPYVLAKKIYAVLKWKYKNRPTYAKFVMNDFAQSLSKNGAAIEL